MAYPIWYVKIKEFFELWDIQYTISPIKTCFVVTSHQSLFGNKSGSDSLTKPF